MSGCDQLGNVWRTVSLQSFPGLTAFPHSLSMRKALASISSTSIWVLRLFDFFLLFAAATLFGACLTAKLQTGSYGWIIPNAPYIYETRDFFVQATASALVGLLVLCLFERVLPWRHSVMGRCAAFGIATLTAIYVGPPDPTIFGNTWTRWEVTMTLFLGQMDIALPIAGIFTLLRFANRRLR